MRKIVEICRIFVENAFDRFGLGMRAKLIIIFVVIKVIPLVLLAVMAWRQSWLLGRELGVSAEELMLNSNKALEKMRSISVSDSVKALNDMATDDIERMTTDTARAVADFLYARDADIELVASMPPDEKIYRGFVENKRKTIVKEGRWELAPDGKSWIPSAAPPPAAAITSSNRENDIAFQYRPPDAFEYESRPLYLEITFVDTDGNERIKVTTSPRMDGALKNVSDRRNTYVRAETYFSELKKLKPGEIYVSDVIGAYVGTRYIGMYTPGNTAAAGVDFRPDEDAYAGMENPRGKRFRGVVRWAAPVVRDGRIEGYVTLALDHDHLMEFTSHIMPTGDRYTELPNAYEGNYAFIWDYKCRNIVHPRHHSIVGYDPETGDPQIPWLEQSIYDAWQESGKSYVDFIKDQPVFVEQSRQKRPAAQLTKAGLVALDGRYLNNAPQCVGWFDLTKEGGSGSFNILWSGLYKLTTAAAIPYYTGQYGQSKRGFGVVTIGAGLEHFQRPAHEMEEMLEDVAREANDALTSEAEGAQQSIRHNLLRTTTQLTVSAGVMIIIVVLIAIWMASIFTRSITRLISGISRFRSGERHFRFNAKVKDELGALADSFDEMADSLVESVDSPMAIVGMDERTIYINERGLNIIQKSADEVMGLPYKEVSIYPPNSVYCPIKALEEGSEAEMLYLPDEDLYLKGKATYLCGKNGEKTGYIIVSEDLTDMAKEQIQLRETQAELEKAVSEANRANECKGDFLARMSHEIRTPMNAIIGMTSIVKRKLMDDGEASGDIISNLRQIEDSSQHLLGLLNDILDFSKIDAGKVDLSMEGVNVHKLANTVASMIRPRCDEKNIEFDMKLDVSPGAVAETDPLRLRQVLINLLGNSVKFTNELGRVEFSIIKGESSGGVAPFDFIVRDNGVGISDEAMERLFQPFEQGNAGVARRYGGTGLGLAISRSIVRMLGGDIAVQSRPGEGSVFSFRLAMKELEAEEAAGDDAAVEGRDLFAGKRALLVDDVAINRMIAIDLMEFTGLDIDEAEDGEEAVRLFEASPEGTYDIIYMDVRMPKMDGYEASARIRSLARADARSVPIIALTANAFKDDIENAIRNGMNAHLAKPLDIQKLIDITFKLIGSS
jgi:signal transduction histidine kinase/CheY-like chemotaxis protein/HAMP domain-containing protein